MGPPPTSLPPHGIPRSPTAVSLLWVEATTLGPLIPEQLGAWRPCSGPGLQPHEPCLLVSPGGTWCLCQAQ